MTLEDRSKLFKGFTYNPETGDIISRYGRKITSKDKHGYIVVSVKIDKKSYHISAHQLAWYLYYNEVPTILDHINRNRSDNRISNLRLVTNQENHYNQGAKGYTMDCRGKCVKYVAKIKYNNKCFYIGSYNTPNEAHEAYLKEKKKYYKYEEYSFNWTR